MGVQYTTSEGASGVSTITVFDACIQKLTNGLTNPRGYKYTIEDANKWQTNTTSNRYKYVIKAQLTGTFNPGVCPTSYIIIEEDSLKKNIELACEYNSASDIPVAGIVNIYSNVAFVGDLYIVSSIKTKPKEVN